MSADAISNLWRRVLLAIGRGRVRTVTDTGNVQVLQIKAGADETLDGVPRLAEYGFQSSPPAGSDAVLVFVAGERSNGVVIACGNQTYRMKSLATGEVAISDDKGQSVYLSAAGIRVNGGGLPLTINNTPHVTVTADALTLNGPTTINGDAVINGRTTHNGDTALVGGLAQTGAGVVAFLSQVSAPDFVSPALSLSKHRHGGVRGGSDSSGTAIPLT